MLKTQAHKNNRGEEKKNFLEGRQLWPWTRPRSQKLAGVTVWVYVRVCVCVCVWLEGQTVTSQFSPPSPLSYHAHVLWLFYWDGMGKHAKACSMCICVYLWESESTGTRSNREQPELDIVTHLRSGTGERVTLFQHILSNTISGHILYSHFGSEGNAQGRVFTYYRCECVWIVWYMFFVPCFFVQECNISNCG